MKLLPLAMSVALSGSLLALGSPALADSHPSAIGEPVSVSASGAMSTPLVLTSPTAAARGVASATSSYADLLSRAREDARDAAQATRRTLTDIGYRMAFDPMQTYSNVYYKWFTRTGNAKKARSKARKAKQRLITKLAAQEAKANKAHTRAAACESALDLLRPWDAPNLGTCVWMDYLPTKPPPGFDSVSRTPEDGELWRDLMLDEVNTVRASVGAPPLQLCRALNDSAQLHAVDLAKAGVMSHNGPEGEPFWWRMMNAGYSPDDRFGGGENVSVGPDSVREVMASWVNSPGHYANIINTSYTHVGFGYGYRTYTQYRTHWAQNFGYMGDCDGKARNLQQAPDHWRATKLTVTTQPYIYDGGTATELVGTATPSPTAPANATYIFRTSYQKDPAVTPHAWSWVSTDNPRPHGSAGIVTVNAEEWSLHAWVSVGTLVPGYEPVWSEPFDFDFGPAS